MSIYKNNRRPNELTVVTKSKELLLHTFLITDNTKKFPKKHRFTIVNRVQTECLDLLKNLIRANEIFPRNKDDVRKRMAYQKEAMTNCKMILVYIELSNEVASVGMDSIEYWAKLVLDVRRLLVSWINADIERYRSLLQ